MPLPGLPSHSALPAPALPNRFPTDRPTAPALPLAHAGVKWEREVRRLVDKWHEALVLSTPSPSPAPSAGAAPGGMPAPPQA